MVTKSQTTNGKEIDHVDTVILFFDMANVWKRKNPHENLICLKKDEGTG